MMDNKQGQPKEYKTIAFKGYKLEEDEGIVEHIVSVFGIEDLGGDVVHPGAFKKTIQERSDRIRVLDSHRRDSVLDVLGKVLSLKEIPRDELPAEILEDYPKATGGLWARTQFLLDTPEGKGVFARIKSGAVSEFSFGYDTLDEDFSDDEKGHEVRNLRTIRLWEYSPVIFGMNPATTVLGVKSEDEEDAAPVFKGKEEKPAPDVKG
jgi:HK97 family phage prohead protease